ncbi:MAG TPA: PstC family ABC transporter permease, partial [Candidatus Binataceae bacterium]|nr:PstC family ABC transporter permease [Candidatus Binataceae bacterium]
MKAAQARIADDTADEDPEFDPQMMPAPEEISQPPSTLDLIGDRAFRRSTLIIAWMIVGLVFWLVGSIGWQAAPAVRAYGFNFLTGSTWDPNKAQFGILPAIVGTLYSSVLGLMIGTVFGLAIAIFLSEGFLSSGLEAVLKALKLSEVRPWNSIPSRLEDLLRLTVELLAAIPSVVYGLWGIFVVIPMVRPMADWLFGHLGWIPIFGTPLAGPGLFPASIVLAIMVLPTISAISRDALVAVPPKMREAAFGMGATRWEAILAIFIPTAATGIFGAVILGFGRALGETMALAMLAGNANVISWSLFSPANTLAALLANHFPE